MEKNLLPSEKLEEILDKIFLLNHNLVSEMISSSQDEEYKRYPKLNEELENKGFEELSDYYRQLREAIRECLRIGDEVISQETGSLSQDAKQEVIIQEREDYKDKLIEIMEARIKALFVAMDFIPVGKAVEDEDLDLSDVPGYYTGKPEEAIREEEYNSLMSSLTDQMEIIFVEDSISNGDSSELFLSPYIVPYLIDAIGNKTAFEKAEQQCEKYVAASRKQEEVFDEFPELRDTCEQVEFLRIKQRYKRRFEEATGFLNPNTSYTEYFMNAFKLGTVPFLSGFSQKEIDDRILNRVRAYTETNKDTIHSIFKSSMKKHANFRRKRQLKEFLAAAKFQISDLPNVPKRWTRKLKEGKKKEVKPEEKTPGKNNSKPKKKEKDSIIETKKARNSEGR